MHQHFVATEEDTEIIYSFLTRLTGTEKETQISEQKNNRKSKTFRFTDETIQKIEHVAKEYNEKQSLLLELKEDIRLCI